MTAFEKLFGLIQKNEKRTGSDYTATVTRVKDGTAYVQITGAEITDTPVAMSVDAKAGDQVRVRVNNGKAWLTGNDSRPPNDSTDDLDAVTKANTEISTRLDVVEKFLNKFKPKVVNVTSPYGTVKYVATGYTVSVSMILTGVPISAWTNICTGMPVPLVSFYTSGLNGASNNDLSVCINTSGTLMIYGRNASNNSTVITSFTYVTLKA